MLHAKPLAPTVSGADGAFKFAGLHDGYAAVVEPSATGLYFLPRSHYVHINPADCTGLAFTGFAVTGVACSVPATAAAGSELTLAITVHDVVSGTQKFVHCSSARLSSGDCGPGGKLWKPRKGLISCPR